MTINPAGGYGNYRRQPFPLGGPQTTQTATNPAAGTTANENPGVAPVTGLQNAQGPATRTYSTAPAGMGNSFTAQSNLIGQQFNPSPSARLQTAQGYTTGAAQSLANWQPQPWQGITSPNQSSAMGQFATANQQMQGLSSAGYRPVAGTDLSGARAQLGAASQGVGNTGASQYAGAGQSGGFSYGGDTGQVRAMGLDQLKNVLNTTPDRATLSSSAFQRMLDESNPAFEQELRSTNQRNAAMGRRGSGLATQDLGTVQQRREEALMRERGRLADEAAGLSLADAQAKLGAAQGFGESLAGQDTAAGSLNLGYLQANNAERGAAFDRTRALGNDAFGQRMSLADAETRFGQIGRQDALGERDAMNDAERYGNELTAARAGASRQYGQDLYGQARDTYGDMVGERDARNAYDQQQFGNRRNVFGDLGAYEQGIANNERADRNEMRGERDYQYGLSRDAQGDRISQLGMEEQIYGQDFNRDMQRFGLGYGMDPSGAMGDYAALLGNQGAQGLGAGADLLSQWGMRRNRRTSGSQGPSGPAPQVTIPDFELPDYRRS